MALANYSNLQAEIALYLARSDLTAIIPDFITLSEAKLKRRFKDITPLSAGNNWLFTAYPDVYLYGALLEAYPYLQDDARIATWAQIFEKVVSEVRHPDSGSNFTNYTGLKLAIADWLARPDIDSNIPNFIELAEAKLQRKFKGVTSLNGATPTNWLLTAHPDAYLYGALVEAEPYLKDDARIAIWKAGFDEVVSQIRLPDTASTFVNYSGLQAAVADWLNRSDLDNEIDNFIRLAEARFAIKFKSFTILSAGAPTNSVLTNYPDIYLYGTLVEAANYLQDNVNLPIWKQEFENRLALIRVTDSATSLANYTGLQAAIIDWADRPDLTENAVDFIQLAETKLQRRFKGVTALSVGSPTNFLLTNYPDTYLYGSLVELALYIKDEAKAAAWKAVFDSTVDLIRYPDSASTFTNYSGLQASIADWLERPDLATEIPNFIKLAETKFSLKFKNFTGLSTGSPTNSILTNYPDVYLYGSLVEAATYLKDTVNLPALQNELATRLLLIRVADSTSSFDTYAGLQSAAIDWLARPDLATAVPNFIRLAEAQFQRKFLGVTTLGGAVTTNWLLTNHPDIYLYGTLLESAPYLKDDARVALWQAEYDRRIVSVRYPTTSGGFTTYTTLQATIADWLNRPDLSAAIPTFISLAEKRLSRDLRIRQMLKVVTTTAVAGDSTVELPSDYLQMRDLHLDTNPIQSLAYQSPSNFYRNTNSTISGVPLQYTVLAQEFQFAPIPDGDYTLQMIYYAAPPALSAGNASNMFLANCPDLLLYGALSEAEPYLMNDPRIQVWASLYDRALTALTVSDDQGEYGGSPLSISIATR